LPRPNGHPSKGLTAPELNPYDQKGTHEVTTRTTLPVSGMTCTGCENNIRFAHAFLEGVLKANPRT
jgi:hypothetical protein